MTPIAPLLRNKHDLRGRNKNLRTVHLELTPENQKKIADYQNLVKKINAYPSRIGGLRMNFKTKQIPAQIARLAAERERDMEELIAMEAVLFPK